MKVVLRVLAVLLFVAMSAVYVAVALAAGNLFGWLNGWMTGVMISFAVLVTVFVLTMRRTGSRGDVISNLGAALKKHKFVDEVAGVAQVVTASGQPRSGQNAGYGMCEMNLVITVPGQPSVAVDTASIVPLAKWPTPGAQLPVRAERNNPRIFEIVWGDVATGWEAGALRAQQIANQMNGAAGFDLNGDGKVG